MTTWGVVIIGWSLLILFLALFVCRGEFRVYRRLRGGVWYRVEMNHELVWTRNPNDGLVVSVEG